MVKYFELNNFFSTSECNFAVNCYLSNLNIAYQWRDTFPIRMEELPIEYKNNMMHLVERIDNEIRKNFNVTTLSNLEIVRWPNQSFMNLHIDKGDKCGFFVYLNTGFLGGETFLDTVGNIVPEIGKLLYFNNGDVLHSVNKVLGVDRFTLAGWYI